MRFLCATLTTLALFVVAADEASAVDLGRPDFGLRGGISMNPDQFHGGVFADLGLLTRDVRFQPSFDFGWGNGLRLATANADALYLFARQRSWRPYAGGGLGVNFIDVVEGVGQARGLEIEAVLNLVGGVEWGGDSRTRAGRRYVLELRVGIGDTPDMKLSAGIRF